MQGGLGKRFEIKRKKQRVSSHVYLYGRTELEKAFLCLRHYALRKVDRKYQSLKGAVGAILCQNEEELKISKEIDHQISSTDKAGKIRLIFPACSVSEIWWKFPLEIILLPHSDRGSCQLLLSIPERNDALKGR